MKFTGIITEVTSVVSGTTQAGKEWRRIDCVLTYDISNANFPKAITFSVMNDRINELNLQKGCRYEVDVDFTVRTHEGHFYMSASAWRATALPGA